MWAPLKVSLSSPGDLSFAYFIRPYLTLLSGGLRYGSGGAGRPDPSGLLQKEDPEAEAGRRWIRLIEGNGCPQGGRISCATGMQLIDVKNVEKKRFLANLLGFLDLYGEYRITKVWQGTISSTSI